MTNACRESARGYLYSLMQQPSLSDLIESLIESGAIPRNNGLPKGSQMLLFEPSDFSSAVESILKKELKNE